MNRLLLAILLLAGCSKPDGADPILQLDLGMSADTDTREDASRAPDAATTDMATGADVTAAEDVGTTPDMADNRRSLGQIYNTYYWLSLEADYPGAKTVALNNEACQPIAMVSEAYADAVCIEGSGRLEDGTVINYESICNCGRPCSSGRIICWTALDPATQPWGLGAFGNALVPGRSLAVDPNFVPLKTVIYIEQFDGVEIPALGGVEGFTHDGCFRADDVGGAIDGNHVDIFAGSEPLWRHLEGVFPTRSNLDAWLDVAKCAYLEL